MEVSKIKPILNTIAILICGVSKFPQIRTNLKAKSTAGLSISGLFIDTIRYFVLVTTTTPLFLWKLKNHFPIIYWYFLFQLFNKCKVLYYQWLFLVWFSRVSHGDGANGILGNIEHCVHPKSSDQGYRVGCWNLLDILLCHCTTECNLPRSSYFEASTGKLRFYITHINAEIKNRYLFYYGLTKLMFLYL